jgi:hypothetical protein
MLQNKWGAPELFAYLNAYYVDNWPKIRALEGVESG